MNEVSDTVGYSLAFARDMVPAKMAAYSAALPPIYQKFVGQYLAIGGPGRGVERLAGDWGDRSVMLGVFPDYAAVGEFWTSPEYRAAAKLRVGAVKVDACRLPGRRAPDEHQAMLLLAVKGADDLPALLESATSVAPAARVLAPLAVGGFEALEGDLHGHEIGLLSFPDLGALQTAWAELRPRLMTDNTSVQAYAVNRAPRP
ncbi:MAG TPA: DUF1330 domain-containing protein [Steroidobacteraceae bacterium]|nr:DUF1330 domain-containing protein [Steroidobacteraceae bacterium]